MSVTLSAEESLNSSAGHPAAPCDLARLPSQPPFPLCGHMVPLAVHGSLTQTALPWEARLLF